MVHLRLASRAEITLAVAELHKAAKCSKRSAKSSKQKTYHRLSERVYKNCDRRECSRLAKGIVWRPEQRLGFEDFQEETSVTLQALQALKKILRSLSATTPRQLSLIVWSVAQLNQSLNQSLINESQLNQSSSTNSTQLNLCELRSLRSGLEAQHILDLFAEVQCRVMELDMQGTSMVMWSLALLSSTFPSVVPSTQPLFDLLATCASTKLPEFSTQGIANMLWSCAVLDKDPMPLMLAVQQKPAVSLVSFASTQAAANIVWAMARLSRAGSPLQEEAARVAAQKSRELQPEEAAAIVWAVAVQSHSLQPHAECALRSIVEQAASSLSSKPLAACAWSLATILICETQLWVQVETAAVSILERPKGFNTQELANLFWAFATSPFASSSAPSMWKALANDAFRQKEEFSAVELAAVSWAMAAKRFVWPIWSSVVPTATCLTLNLRGLASLAWSWATLNFETDSFLCSVAQQALHLMETYWKALPRLPETPQGNCLFFPRSAT